MAAMLAAAWALAACGGNGGGDSGGVVIPGGGDSASGGGGSGSGGGGADSGSGGEPTPVVPPATPGTAVAGDIVNTAGQVDPDAYKAMAAKLSTDEGITYRFGPASGGRTATTLYEAPSTAFTRAQRPNDNPSMLGDWQVGGPAVSDPGDYFSNGANALYVADSPNYGVSVFVSITQGRNTFTQKPQLNWVFGNEKGGGINEYHAMEIGARNPVAAARCYGRPGWCQLAVVAYQDGRLATAVASNNSQNRVALQLPATMVPTAITLTNSGEFALVTVWDTARVRGRVAVVALAGLCAGCTVSNPDRGDVGWGDWGAVNPGLPNRGNFAFMKLLGFVELPDGLRAPTAISATTGWDPWEGRERVAQPRGSTEMSSAYRLALTDETNRQSFASGNNVNSYAKAGIAVVVSKSERRAAFIDLRPLFAYYKKMYFGSREDFNRTRALGGGDSQWPYAFSVAGEQKPTVVKTLDLGARPTAVKNTLWGANPAAWIGTQEGQLQIVSLGNYARADGAVAGTPSEIQHTGSVTVGSSIAGLSYFRARINKDHSPEINSQVIVLSRSERAIRWVTFSGDHRSGNAVNFPKTPQGPAAALLQDSRLVDPVDVEDNETHGTEAYVLSVADYGGRAVRNYRYGPVIFRTNGGACQPPSGCGMGANNGDSFEYGSALSLPGKPFFVSSSNVP